MKKRSYFSYKIILFSLSCDCTLLSLRASENIGLVQNALPSQSLKFRTDNPSNWTSLGLWGLKRAWCQWLLLISSKSSLLGWSEPHCTDIVHQDIKCIRCSNENGRLRSKEASFFHRKTHLSFLWWADGRGKRIKLEIALDDHIGICCHIHGCTQPGWTYSNKWRLKRLVLPEELKRVSFFVW